MIASDDNNPQFMGAHNPDSRLTVRFYKEARPNEFKTKEEGHPVYIECDMVEIHCPGDQRNIMRDFVNESHKLRFPRQWAIYLNSNREGDQLLGTPVSEWAMITRSQAEELKGRGFMTVEAVAGASDQQLQAIGMLAGMQPHTFRERARNFLQAAGREANLTAENEAKAKAEAELKETRDALNELRAQMAAMQEAQPERNKPGRKPKVETESA